MIPRYVFDAGALIAAEHRKDRATRFLRLAHVGRARILVPLPVVAEWWRGRSDRRQEILEATELVSSLEAAKAAGIALGQLRELRAKLTIDALVMATAALTDAAVVTGDVADFARLAHHFAGVTVLAI